MQTDFTREEWPYGSTFGTKGLARHLFTRLPSGKVVIIAEKPDILHASLRKQWLKLARKVQRERSSTLNATRVLRLADMASKMQSIQFTTDWPHGYEADVCIATVEQLTEWLPNCRTLYVTCDISTQQLQVIVARMPIGSLVVVIQAK
jgi:hypothetical protein